MKYSAYKLSLLLGVQKATVLKWIEKGKIRAKTKPVGGRAYYEIEEKEFERIKGRINKQAGRGHPILSE